MSTVEFIYPGGFRPEDEVMVVDGTFASMNGKVLRNREKTT